MQLRELREYCAQRNWEVTGEYVDHISGAKDKRPEVDRLMADAHRRRFAAVVVRKFDRFARSVSHLLRALETFRALGIEFVSLSEQMDTATPAGKMVFTVLGAVAELERSLIVERVKAGLRNARAKGKRLGRPRVSISAARVQDLRAEGLVLLNEGDVSAPKRWRLKIDNSWPNRHRVLIQPFATGAIKRSPLELSRITEETCHSGSAHFDCCWPARKMCSF